MHPRSKLSQAQRELAVDLFEEGYGSRAVANRLGVRREQVRHLEDRFRLHGRLCLVSKRTKRQYSFDAKMEILRRHKAGELKSDLAKEYGLSSPNLISHWVWQVNKGGSDALQPKPKGRPKGSGQSVPMTEEDTLRRENELLKAEVAYPKKIAGLEGTTTRLKVEAIITLKSEHRLDDLIAVSGLARSTFFDHQRRLDLPDKYADLKEQITTIFYDSNATFGYRRIWRALRNNNTIVNKKVVQRLMREQGLVSKIRRKKYNSYRGTVSHIADNVLGRRFIQDAPNKVWVSDVTEFRVAGTKVYLSPVMDLFDRTILAHTLSTSPNTQLTSRALADAIAMFSPGKGLIVHTDQGFQYQHASWRNLIESVGGVQSMSRKGNCYDNAVMENFFGHLKSEMYHDVYFTSVDELCQAIDEYILWYNTTRLQERFKGLAPMQYRNQTLAKTLTV
ncbi:IS3 family transposase [Corynebacterium diphtheriae bv. mitis]|uniref:IS3 family transposase n=1 Tax=Corynebacterium diphtheriae TaxID=1717 RepID=UPI001FD4CBC4|nr:IS3 family transposase [Corynebacterium diphtheriae]UWE98866.1 IS3 family transposase [Corynebacterium diphtheriae bv. mitis]UWF00059.1 IS3 family transposase [Corynebacterium diphtheriae bv. mitis]UWF13570.1 IS3 family transposase [Corynebacterium diphtheriae bv. mitis]UWF22340.1 IS3 family transposase [Corynebacterium diphtheriae bv. mitis]UWF26746.1 IS3 family transposase [Corynebacterium diphtheriae bv. mitis]